MGPWEEKPKCAKTEAGEKHCWSHCWLHIMKCSRLYIQNISQHFLFHTSILIPTQTLLRLARKILRFTGGSQQRDGSGASTAARRGAAAAGALGQSPRVVATPGWAGAAWQSHPIPSQPGRAAGP